MRLVLKVRDKGMTREESYRCEKCGEDTGTNWIRIRDGKKVCLDCYHQYDRFRM